MISNKLQIRNYTFLVGIMMIFLIAKLDASDPQPSEESTRIIHAATTEVIDDKSVIKLTCSSNEARICAIKGPQISGTKESLIEFLNFIKRLLSNNMEAIKIQLTHDTCPKSTYTASYLYGPYHETRSKSWYSDIGALDPKEFEATLDKALENPEEECTIIWYQSTIVLGTKKYASVYDISGSPMRCSQFYDLKISR